MAVMRATTIHGPGDIRVEEVPDPSIKRPTDAIVKVAAGCVCGSDLWPYRGENPIQAGSTIGHECIGIVEEVGADVKGFRPGDFVIVPFCTCDNTCPHCLVATDGVPDAALLPSLLALSDVMPTGWHASGSAGVTAGGSVVVVGDGAVGLCGVLAASVMGAET